jgi:hypothetical protein
LAKPTVVKTCDFTTLSNPHLFYEKRGLSIKFIVSPNLGGVDVEHSSHLQLLVNTDTKRTMAKVFIGERNRSQARFRVFLQAF